MRRSRFCSPRFSSLMHSANNTPSHVESKGLSFCMRAREQKKFVALSLVNECCSAAPSACFCRRMCVLTVLLHFNCLISCGACFCARSLKVVRLANNQFDLCAAVCMAGLEKRPIKKLTYKSFPDVGFFAFLL